MISLTFIKLLPRLPPGWFLPKSDLLKPLKLDKETEMASPIIIIAVVLDVGAKLRGSASFSILIDRWALEDKAMVDFSLPVTEHILIFLEVLLLKINSGNQLLPHQFHYQIMIIYIYRN